MPYWYEGMDFETKLADERSRLVRLCAWFSGNQEAAEDLAQETLMAAWKSRDQLTSLDKLKPWTSAIARNICLNWTRGYYREQAHTLYSIDAPEESFKNELQDEINLELDLDRSELAKLLDQALSLLPAETAQMLVEHYIKESSHAEIAKKMKMNPGAVAVRLQRGKLSLQKLLRTNLQAEASAFGWITPGNSQWEETNIWCPWCGQVRLLGRYQRNELFALRCPRCDPDPQSIMAGLDLTKPYHANLLGHTKTYKPAYARLLNGFAPLYREALKSHTAPCLACGRRLEVLVEHGRETHKPLHKFSQVTLHCPVCNWVSNKSLSGLVIALPEAQRFWREYPRMKTLPAQEIEVHGTMAFLTRLQSVTGNAELTAISRRDTFELIEVHTNVKL
ncbi:MAG TPA: RNA polymerase sigma factor [Anaerolineales bacterium]|nr:RNA polymerase sigma factor [Anaerolineales bacterium]